MKKKENKKDSILDKNYKEARLEAFAKLRQ